ncbi:MAG: DUF3237 domain-containing protein [Rhodospirillaceae bacterium]|jgi:hypothetical protein|nr:DUF3237 domain-containing protein [Rhodospirillaceae bacterium]MBT4488793.1 DUF3237 domain-containing protein [Rhodospirillaceae bacterium]MBT5194062.1 DUF3237 domain-containing protein [Rhodospirillaceae bacterium]MBT5898929.1 DUF3237 domain-containing protein [Rhodospirillaceae bacterium]MBT6427257.1 DUF3237 domain-containing protein [Rhodospirillaceae bacterium]
MNEIKTEFLFEMSAELSGMRDLGQTPVGNRRVAEVGGGTFEGPRLRGKILPAAAGDWLIFRPDGVLQLDVRLTLETDDGAYIYMTYRGVRHGPEDVIARLNAGEDVDASEYYFRTAPFFETGAEKYAWLNSIICVGTGHRLPAGPVYRVFEVL